MTDNGLDLATPARLAAPARRPGRERHGVPPTGRRGPAGPVDRGGLFRACPRRPGVWCLDRAAGRRTEARYHGSNARHQHAAPYQAALTLGIVSAAAPVPADFSRSA